VGAVENTVQCMLNSELKLNEQKKSKMFQEKRQYYCDSWGEAGGGGSMTELATITVGVQIR
jgi:hypothetical protein